MKKTIKVSDSKGKLVDKEINYIPFRYIIAMFLTIVEIALIVLIMILCAIYIPYFYLAMYITVIGTLITIIGSNENPDHKIPWLLFVIVLPVVGFMLYFLFYKRKLPKKIIKRLERYQNSLNNFDEDNLQKLKNKDMLIYSQALELCNISNTHLYQDTKLTYFKSGKEMFIDMISELNNAKKFVFLEFFIIEEGIFWNTILEVLKKKAINNVEVKVVYDDIGCMSTLPGNYYKVLKQYNIDVIPFSKLKGKADGEFNNRSHRKILVIDGEVGYTGGVNIADEYINVINKYGHWKDTGIKLEGMCVNELTKLFLTDFYINKKETNINFKNYYIDNDNKNKIDNYVVPFGDGPRPIYENYIGKVSIMNLLNHAKEYVYITTPYLIVDNEMLNVIKNTALRGVDVRIIIPHIPDKKFVFMMSKFNALELISKGVKIYEYEPGFIHAKSYISDDNVGIIGTINLDYRSLTHHFENGVWIYNDPVIKDMKNDFIETQEKSYNLNIKSEKTSIFKTFLCKIIKIFSPLL